MKKSLVIPLLVAITLAAAGDAAAARPEKPPWEWTLAERLTARFGPPSVVSKERFIHGRLNPELLTPTELFDHLVLIRTNGWRALPDETIRAAGYQPAEFRRDIGVLMANYIRRASEYNAHVLSGGREEAKYKRAVCRERIVALQAMRKRFRQFDRFLYTAIAPITSTFRGFEALLRDHESGCPGQTATLPSRRSTPRTDMRRERQSW